MTRPNENIERFVIRGYDTDDVRLAVNWLVRYARDHGLRRATLYTHDRGSVENLREAIGATSASRLQRDHSVVMNGITVQSATHRDYPRALEPVLAVWATDDELIDRLDSANVPALCAIPWSDQLENWIGKWGPVDLATGKPVSGFEATITNRTVRRALRSVTTMANLSKRV